MNTQVYANGAVILKTKKPVCHLEINRPKTLNSLNLSVWESLVNICSSIQKDDSIKLLIISGSGNRAFSSGADISEFSEVYADRTTTEHYNKILKLSLQSIVKLRIPVIASINGICFGGGCSLAMACDLRFATPNSRFAITPAKLGLAYSIHDSQRLVAMVGTANAKDLLFSGREIDSNEAKQMGLVSRIVEENKIDAEVEEYGSLICSAPELALRATKATIDFITFDFAAHDKNKEIVQKLIDDTFSSQEFKNRYQAFLRQKKKVSKKTTSL